MPETDLVERNTPVANQVATEVADELAPEIRRATSPVNPQDMERAQLEEHLHKKVQEHLDGLSGERVMEIGRDIIKSESTDATTKQNLEGTERDLRSNSQTLKEVLFSALTGKDKTGMQRIEDLTPEERKQAEANLRELLESSSDEELIRLFDKVGIKTGSPTETRQELIDALMKSQLLERSLRDPSVAATVSESLANSGKLSSELSASLRDVIEKTRETLDKIKEIVGKELEKRIHRYIERVARSSAPGTPLQMSADDSLQSKTDWPFYVEFLRALDDSGELKLFDPTVKKDDEVQRGLNAIGEALQEKEKKEAKQEQERRDVEADLRREIQRIARQAPAVFNSLIGLSVSQTQYLDPMVVAYRTPPYESAFD